MHVLLLADAPFAEHERALLERIAAGLTGEGVRVSVAIPRQTGATFALLSDPILYSDRGLLFTQRIRAEQVAEAIAGTGATREGIVDVVHVFGGGAWAMGVTLAELLGAALAYEIWRGGLVDRVGALRHPSGLIASYFAPDRPIEQALGSADAGVTSRLTPWGAIAPPQATSVLRAGCVPSVVFLSSGRDAEQCRSAFAGVIEVARESDDLLVFVAADAVRRAGLWKAADRAGVLDRITLIDRLEDRRDLVLRSDIIVYPDARHEQRTILLDAMASGLVVLAAPDPLVSAIVPGITARTPDTLTAGGWHDVLGDALRERDASIALGLSAREHIRQSRRASTHIASLVDAYAWLTGSDMVAVQPSG
ncbi:MAG: hypothetical protein AAGA55_04475 [Planctomycetota bacterium]